MHLMDGLPTTPVQRTPMRGSPNNIRSVVGHSVPLKAHPHGLSSKKKLEQSYSYSNSPLSKEPASQSSEMSLDGIKRSHQSHLGVADEPKSQWSKNALDQMDINKMFSGETERKETVSEFGCQSGSVLKVNHSPIRVELSSPSKLENDIDDDVDADADYDKCNTNGIHEGPSTKRLKLEIESVPNLTQPDINSNEVGNEDSAASPEAIEMIETNSSPMKDVGDIMEENFKNKGLLEIRESVEGYTDYSYQINSETPKQLEEQKHISSLHTLTPVHNENNSERKLSYSLSRAKEEILEKYDSFQIVSKRNEELVDQIHFLNKKLNEMMRNSEVKLFHYKNIKIDFESLSRNYDNKLNELQEKSHHVVQERDKLKERIAKVKQRFDQTRDEVNMLNQNQSILQKKYEIATKETDKWKKNCGEMEEDYLQMKDEAKRIKQDCVSLKSQIEEKTSQLLASENSNIECKHENEKLKREAGNLQNQLQIKKDEIVKLETQLNEAVSAQEGSEDEVMKQLDDLATHKCDLETKLQLLQKELDQEKEIMHGNISGLKQQLNDALNALRESKERTETLQKLLDENIKQNTNLQRDYEGVSDDAEIHKAEVTELNFAIGDLKNTKSHLETTMLRLEDEIKKWQGMYKEQTINYEKVSLELESLCLKNSNIEAEHLAELEQLHENLSSLQNTLKINSEVINQLKNENQILKDDKKTLEDKGVAKLQEMPKTNDENLISSFNKQIEEWKEKFHNKEQESNSSLKLLAEDLYIQYSSKHEQKVKLLKKGYEVKYKGKLDNLYLQNEGLTQEIDQLKNQLTSERKEKQKLIGMLETRNK